MPRALSEYINWWARITRWPCILQLNTLNSSQCTNGTLLIRQSRNSFCLNENVHWHYKINMLNTRKYKEINTKLSVKQNSHQSIIY